MGDIYQYLFVTALVIASASLILAILFFTLKFVVLRGKIKNKYVVFEVKPLYETLQSALSTQQLFVLIHGLLSQRSLLDKLIDNYKNYSFEIVSTKREGIKYLIRINEEDADLMKRSLLSYLPGIIVNKVEDYLPADISAKPYKKIVNFKLSKHFAYPLKKQKELRQHDPIAYITGSMTKLSEADLVSFQITLAPVGRSTLKEINKITHDIYLKRDLAERLKNYESETPLLSVFKKVMDVAIHILAIPVGLLIFVGTGGKEGPLPNIQLSSKKKASNIYQSELEKIIKNKLDQQLFSASLRLLVIGDSQAEVKNRIRGFTSALSSFSTRRQSLASYMNLKHKPIEKWKIFTLKNRLPELFGNSVLSASEAADIYHFPYTSTTKTEDLVKLHSRQLPAPVSLKKADNLDVVFAKNEYGGNTTAIGLTQEERRRHVYILGATGTGKSTMLLSMIEQDIKKGKGVGIIDPHGDLNDQILSIIPEKRISDVVYFNPDDISYPIGINLLELTPGLSDDEALREKEFIAESIISIFHKIYEDRYSGPRMEYILRNTIHTAFTVPDATLFTVYKLLVNTSYRKSVTQQLNDENLKDFWRYEFAKAGDYQKVKMISPITNKIGRFLFSPTAKRILEQPKSTVNFDEILSDGKILLCNLSKGKIGEDNSSVFGTLVMAKIQLASLKRARVPQERRKDFFLYVDEFQNFATPAFAQILSEARKYRLNAILAHQTTSQLKGSSLVNITLANTGTVICFKTANPEDERMILPQFRPYVDQGEIASLPSFHFYMRLGALNPEEPFTGVTVPVKIDYNHNRINDLVNASRSLYAKKYKESAIKTLLKKEKTMPKITDIVP